MKNALPDAENRDKLKRNFANAMTEISRCAELITRANGNIEKAVDDFEKFASATETKIRSNRKAAMTATREYAEAQERAAAIFEELFS